MHKQTPRLKFKDVVKDNRHWARKTSVDKLYVHEIMFPGIVYTVVTLKANSTKHNHSSSPEIILLSWNLTFHCYASKSH
jgi:hypothetical protein